MSDVQEFHLRTQRTARYYVLGSAAQRVSQVWFVCHGYGQLASYFLKHFEVLDDGTRIIVAPEGLSRFYLSGFDGRIGAAWMTREDRLNEIEDYVVYLDNLYTQVFSQVDRADVKVFVLGFSQATATVCRWLARGRATADKMILWAGVFPPEIDLSLQGNVFRKLDVSIVVGKKDKFATPRILDKQRELLSQDSISYRFLEFDGGHTLEPETLKQIARL